MATHKCKCGVWNRKDAQFCRNCGSKLQNKEESIIKTPKGQNISEVLKRTGKITWNILLFLAGLAFLIKIFHNC